MIKNKNGEYIPGILEINSKPEIIRSSGVQYTCKGSFGLTIPARHIGLGSKIHVQFPGGYVELFKTGIGSSTWNSNNNIFFVGAYFTASLTMTNCCEASKSTLTKTGTLIITWNNWNFTYTGTIKNCKQAIPSPLTLKANATPKPPTYSWPSLSVYPVGQQ